MSEFTSGPWVVVGLEDLAERGIDDLMIVAAQVGPDESGRLGELYIVNVGGREPTPIAVTDRTDINVANAKLIAAAPDLYEACRSVIGAFRRDSADDVERTEHEVLRAALEKAGWEG
jgi:hypothetical protein